jgi:hypothetical protein
LHDLMAGVDRSVRHSAIPLRLLRQITEGKRKGIHGFCG